MNERVKWAILWAAIGFLAVDSFLQMFRFI